MLNIVIPMAGRGSRFMEAGYSFPKPLVDVKGRTMIEVVVNNLRPSTAHRFVFICQREHYEKYDLYNVLKNATNNQFEVVQLDGVTEGAAATVLCAKQYVDNDDELLIGNSDQFIERPVDLFLQDAQSGAKDGLIMTFHASHPKWSYARVDRNGKVIETAEKRIISSHATVGLYYFKRGADFTKAAEAMIRKNIRQNNEFYVCPVFNELILEGRSIYIYEVKPKEMHGLGTPEDLEVFIRAIEEGKVAFEKANQLKISK